MRNRSVNKLDERKVAVMRWLLSAGATPKTLAAIFGVSRCTVYNVANYERWEDVKPFNGEVTYHA